MVEFAQEEGMGIPTGLTPEQQTKQQCIFCHIVSGKVESKKIYDDQYCMAILDINPANPGHVLLMPKEHVGILPQMQDDVIGHIFTVAKHISKACIKALKVQGTNIFVANGPAAGQKAQHFMLHIIPRKANDGVMAFTLPHRQMPKEYYLKLHGVLKEQIAKKFQGVVKEERPAEKKMEEKGKQIAAPKGAVEAEFEEVKEAEAKEQKSATGVDLDLITQALLEPKGKGKEKEAMEISGEEIGFMASKKGGKYHMPNCPFLAKIKRENRIAVTKDEAKERELKPCECVPNA
ncbi:HIT domain-containing protein [Candidatus Woesearchaeota archaeon]|nr:HIT domain-containing protein [Candidatus Woesearchaeota archaeon]